MAAAEATTKQLALPLVFFFVFLFAVIKKSIDWPPTVGNWPTR